MADTLPKLNTLNLGFDDLRARMSSFTSRFDEFIEQGRQRVLDERNQFRLQVAQAQGKLNNPTKSHARSPVTLGTDENK